MTATDLVADVRELFSLPEVCLRVNELLEDPEATPAAVGQVVGCDPGLTARLLQLVNSPFYGLPRPVDTVVRAAKLLGLERLRQQVFAAAALESLGRMEVKGLDTTRFWNHSLFCALAARLLAADCEPAHRERYFTAGLLHDLGDLVLFSRVAGPMRRALDAAGAEGRPRFEAEREALGFHHGEVGAELMAAWRFPLCLSEPVRWHHEPDRAEHEPVATAALHIADALAAEADPGDRWPGRIPIAPAAWSATRLSEEVLAPVAAEAGAETLEVFSLLLPGAA
ncbi:MAG: HDOD domain-containing protein [Deferrisomatales bacterium]